jgi:plastocyanin
MKKLIAGALIALLAAAALAIPAFAATNKKVQLADNVFKPRTVTIKKGAKIKFTWTGKAPHNVTVSKGPVKFHSSTKSKGTFTKKFTKKGTYTIICTIHAPSMKMTVKVK